MKFSSILKQLKKEEWTDEFYFAPFHDEEDLKEPAKQFCFSGFIAHKSGIDVQRDQEGNKIRKLLGCRIHDKLVKINDDEDECHRTFEERKAAAIKYLRSKGK